jgi:hypothetical protein
MHSKFYTVSRTSFCIFLHLSSSEIYLTECPFIGLLFSATVYFGELNAVPSVAVIIWLPAPPPPPRAPGLNSPWNLYIYINPPPPPASIRLSSLHFFAYFESLCPPPFVFHIFILIFVFVPFCWNFFKQSMGARDRVVIGLSYRPAWLHRMAEFIPWNRFLGSINV